jgi:deoxyribonuclease-4
MYIGRHITAKGTDFYGSIKKGYETFGGKAYQIFMKTPRQKTFSKLGKVDASKTKEYIETNKLYIVAHSGYLFNIANDPKDSEYAIKTAVDDLVSISELGGRGAVFHVGKHKGNGDELGTKNMYLNVKKILEESAKKAPNSIFILETAAGAGTECCTKLKELEEFRNKFSKDEKKRIRFCLDTCHMFSAGYDYRTEKQVVEFEKEVASTIKWKNVELLHFNDSKAKHASGVDRHESIGEGYIGNTGLREIAKIACSKGIPLILETPKDKVENLKKEIDMVSSWCLK